MSHCVASICPSVKGDQFTLYSKLTREFPNHPLVKDVSEKGDLFDDTAAKVDVPPLPTIVA